MALPLNNTKAANFSGFRHLYAKPCYLRPDEDLAELFSLFFVEATDPLLLVLLDELCDLTAALLLEFEPDERCDLTVVSLLLEEEDELLLLLTLAFRLLVAC